MERETWRVVLATVTSLAVAAGLVAVGIGDSPSVRAENVSCDTAEGVRCDATLVNENNDTGYDLAVRVIGYDADGEVVAMFTADATGDGADAPSVPPGGRENITIGTSPAEGAVEGDVRVVAAEPVAG